MIRQWLRHFWQQQSGATAAEFAIAFPLILFTSMAVLELSLFYFGNQTITSQMNQAVRKAMIGCERSEFDANGRCLNQDGVIRSADPDTIRRQISRKTYGLVNACGPNFTMTAYPLGTAAVSGQMNLGQGGEVVVYEASYNWPVFTPFMWMMVEMSQAMVQFFNGPFNQFTYSTVVRNEPFGNMGSLRRVSVGDCEWREKNS